MLNTFHFPECFAEANSKLRTKFHRLNPAIIEDSVQYAKVEYWLQDIEHKIHNGPEALGWLLKVANRYIYKEIMRLNRFCSLTKAHAFFIEGALDDKIAAKDLIRKLEHNYSKEQASIVIKHAMGYSLQELAEFEHISLSAMKQRHSRILKEIRRKSSHLSL